MQLLSFHSCICRKQEEPSSLRPETDRILNVFPSYVSEFHKSCLHVQMHLQIQPSHQNREAFVRHRSISSACTNTINNEKGSDNIVHTEVRFNFFFEAVYHDSFPIYWLLGMMEKSRLETILKLGLFWKRSCITRNKRSYSFE